MTSALLPLNFHSASSSRAALQSLATLKSSAISSMTKPKFPEVTAKTLLCWPWNP